MRLNFQNILAIHNVTTAPPCKDRLPSLYRPELRLHRTGELATKPRQERLGTTDLQFKFAVQAHLHP